jgi:hypothetical protein
MDEIAVSSENELAAELSRFSGNDYLFRGQIAHYLLSNGSPSLPSSFSRKGCIPPLMLKWTFFATELLRLSRDLDVPLEFVQAMLQHYGWRSFFVDLSASAGVAAWFASHKFDQEHEFHLSEDCFEEGVLLAHDHARYDGHPGDGHIYVLSKQRLVSAGHKLFDLSELSADFPTRPNVQHAWLAGPLVDRGASLSESGVVAHITAPSGTLRDFASRHGFTATDSLFPNQGQDHILRHLLGLPWEEVSQEDGREFSAYRRSLPLPDYEAEFEKFLPPRQAFVRQFWVSDHRPPILAEALFLRMPELAFYVRVEPAKRTFDALLDILGTDQWLVVECPRLLALPHQFGGTEYTKGVVIHSDKAGMLEVSELMVSHPGTVVEGVGINMGYRYRCHDAQLIRVEHPQDCSCNDPVRHHHHLDILSIASARLSENRFERLNDRTFQLLE